MPSPGENGGRISVISCERLSHSREDNVKSICQEEPPYSTPKRKNRLTFLRTFHRFLEKLFKTLGRQVALTPSYFIIFPIFLTVFGITGVQRIRHEDDPEFLFYPATGNAPAERNVFETHFPINYSNFLPHQMTRASGFARVLVSASDTGNIFRQHIWRDLRHLDSLVRNINITYKDNSYVYHNLCAKWNNRCYENRVMNLEPLIPDIEKESFFVNYPIMLYPLILPMDFGGLDVDEKEGIIKSAKAVNLLYFLKEATEDDKQKALLWEQAFLNTMKELKLNSSSFAFFAARSRKDEMLNNTNAIRPYSAITGIIMVLFSVSSVLTTDWVRSKVYLGILGVVSAAMATGMAFGALMYLGVPFISINKIIPFLMIGIGIDDMFVVLAAWRRTRIHDSVPKRLAETYCDAGISVSITSLTNLLSFSVGTFTPILGVQIFCIYTSLCVMLTYVWHLTFFGGCLAVAGYLEQNQRHAVTCARIKAKSEQEKAGRYCFSIWCAGGISESDPWNERDNRPHLAMVFFRDYFGKVLSLKPIKVLVLISFLLYLGGALYGCTTLKEGLDRKHVVQYDSYAAKYYKKEQEQFRKFPYVIQVAITGNITYSNSTTRAQLLRLHDEFEDLPFTAEKIFTQSWIRRWYQYIDTSLTLKQNVTDERSFIFQLRSEYLSGPSNPMAFDIQFNEDFSKILASRFVIYTYEITDTTKETEMVRAFRHVAENSQFNVTVFNPNFILFDQYTMVRPITIQAILIAVVAMVLVSLFFIPNPWCSLLVAVAIVSIEIGVIGYMALWGVNLDQISMINLIMCIGFSVDFSAHISYAYLTAKVKTPEERIQECLYSLGLPIIQGGLSTVICIVTFVLAPSYVYLTFFKIVFLVVILATVHGLFLIPVFLSIFGPKSSTKSALVNASIAIPRVKLCINSERYTKESNTKPQEIKLKENSKIHLKRSFIKSSSGARPDPEGCSNRSFRKENEKSDKLDAQNR